jgi:hypothetical protein
VLAVAAAALAAGLAAFAAAPAAAPRAGGTAPLVLTVSAFNGSHSEPGASFGTVRQGPLTLALSSPDNSLDVLRHSVRLAPLGDGSHRAELTAAVRGSGRLIADLSVGDGAPGRLVDQVTLPAQNVVVEGRVRVAPAEGGYDVTPLELPPSVSLEIESALADKLVALCTGLTLFTPGGDCRLLERTLGRVEVPLPESGEELFLPFAALSDAERSRIDAYLAAAAAARR